MRIGSSIPFASAVPPAARPQPGRGCTDGGGIVPRGDIFERPINPDIGTYQPSPAPQDNLLQELLELLRNLFG